MIPEIILERFFGEIKEAQEFREKIMENICDEYSLPKRTVYILELVEKHKNCNKYSLCRLTLAPAIIDIWSNDMLGFTKET